MPAQVAPVAPAPGRSFADTMKASISDISRMHEQAGDAIAAYLAGEPVELHEVMAAVEEAGIAIEALVEIRNKLVDGLRTAASMQ
jgi:flagellar hook-basal body complex protein FliE